VINDNVQNGRTLQSTLQDIKNELKEFVQTRFDILKNEMQQKMSAYKAALPMAIVAALLLATTWFLLTGAIVAAIALALGWPAAFAIVAGAYLIFGVLIGWLAYKEVTAQSMKPERTLQVLKQDQIWIQQEAKSA
jgi:uncharacterized membrane protein YqjE